MSTRTQKTVTTSLPPEELVVLDRVRKRDNLTRAEALREAIRRYVSQDSDRKIPVEDALPDEIEAIEEGQAQIARGEYVLLDDLKHQMGRPPKPFGRWRARLSPIRSGSP
jgi:predicted DNA-binding protein